MNADIEGDDNSSVSDFFKKLDFKPLPVLVFLAGIFILAIGAGLFLFKSDLKNDDIKIIAAGVDTPSEIVVHIDGAVNIPGVYKLPIDSRVNDAVAAAGGFSHEANISVVNLASKLGDGQKISVPKTGEEVKGVSVSTAIAADGVINVNSASQASLESLPGIGPVTAVKIINGRPYTSMEELLSKKVIGKSVYVKIKDLVSVY
jgi:competence protein ComEA